MITLITGINGAGKTCNTLKYVCETEQFKDRPIYYFNIQDLKLDWTELTEQQVKTWWELPKGSVIVIDECYKIFPTRKAGAVVPEHTKRLAEHRKDGYDFVFICQKVMGQVDAFARGLVERHIHLERKFGTSMVTWYQWNRCVDNTSDYHTRKEAVKKASKLPKKYFDAYKSAEIHTVKPFLPVGKIVVFLIFLSMLVGSVILGYRTISNLGKSDSTDHTMPVDFSGAVGDSSPSSGLLPTHEKPVYSYSYLHTPRVSGIPHTAPIYDDLTVPRSFPRLQCIKYLEGDKAGSCRCFTQQATALNTPQSICESVVSNGYFDATLSDHAPREAYGETLASPGRAG